MEKWEGGNVGDAAGNCGNSGYFYVTVDLAQSRVQRHPSPAPHLHTHARLL